MRTIAIPLLTFALFATPAIAQATFRIVTTDHAGEGLKDPAPREPVGGNGGTTLGEQRRIAIEHAAGIWGSIIDSPIEIILHVVFDETSCSATSAILGSASAGSVYNRFPNAPVENTWYVAALASRLSGLDLDEGTPAITALFNSGLEGDPNCGGGKRWYYGLDNKAGPDQYDLIVVALHEIGHGLGFSTMADKGSGRLLGGKPDIYSNFLYDNETGLGWPQMSDEQRAESVTRNGHLVWSGENAIAAAPGVLGPASLIEVLSPADIQGFYPVGRASFGAEVTIAGVTGQVIAARDAANSDGPSETDGCSQLRESASIAGKIALIDRGECSFTVKSKRAQDAGAIAVIIANNTSSGLLTMTGTDPTITVPVVSVSMVDGAAIRARLEAGVSVTIREDPQRLSGADDLHRVQLYAPENLVGGSSVSHWDRSARPDLLMEPSISPALRHDVDLARDLFADLGWFASAFAGARMTAFVLLDHDRDGLADPGDVVRVRTTIENRTSVIGQGLILEIDLPSALVLLGDTISGGTLAASEDRVRIDLGNLPGDADRVTMFDLMIDPDLAPDTEALFIQGTISGANILPSITDDPSTPVVDDATSLQVSHTPLRGTKQVALTGDRDGSGDLSSLDVLSYVVTITNHSSAPVSGVRYDDLIDSNTSLVTGSVTTSDGSILEGNAPGQMAVRVSAGTIGPGASFEIRYDVVVRDGVPEGTRSITNQGLVSGAEIGEQVTDDPSTSTALDATVIRFHAGRNRSVHRRN